MICFWCKAGWVGDHVCQEAFEIMKERGLDREPYMVASVILKLKKGQKAH